MCFPYTAGVQPCSGAAGAIPQHHHHDQEVGLAVQAVRDGRQSGPTRLAGQAAGVHGGAAHSDHRLPHHLKTATRFI